MPSLKLPREINFLKNEKFKAALLLISGILLFICSLEGIGEGFKLMFSEWANLFLSMVESGVAPYTGLAIGILATTLLESSSAVVATTMISMAGMVEAGLPLASAIRFGVPMVLGANVGTTVGNTITLFAIRRSTTREEFNATIPGVIIDDIYKILTVLLFFPIELTTGFLSSIVTSLGSFFFKFLGIENLLSAFENTIIDILINEPIVKPLAKTFTVLFNPQIGGILFFILWFVMVIVSIDLLITNELNTMIKTDWAERVSSAFNSPVKSFGTGFSITWLVGSSSIGTSLAIPMIATKMVKLDDAYPYLCGCSLATTLDLAQIYGYVAGGIVGTMLGMTHVLLNLFAILIWMITPLRIIPIQISKRVGGYIGSKPYSPLLLLGYSIGTFIILPIIIILIL
jgi:sodium-dependent phosphate cotransporter